MDQRDCILITEHLNDFVRLALPQQAVIDENAGQLVANGFVNQDGSNGRIDAARQTADDFLVANLRADRLDRLLAVGTHRPIAFETSDTDEVFI